MKFKNVMPKFITFEFIINNLIEKKEIDKLILNF